MAALALVVVWRLLPAASPPIFDGVCVQDPYRLVGHSPAPASASTTYPGTSFPTAEVLTTETPAQAQVLMMAGTFSSSSPVVVSLTPEALPAPPPAGQTQEGNAYRINAASAGQSLQPQDPVTVVLRGTGANNALTLYVNSGGSWQPLRTFNLGCGSTFEAVSQKLGDFALFHAGGAAGGSSGGGLPVAAIVAGVVAVIIAATLGLARLGAQRRR